MIPDSHSLNKTAGINDLAKRNPLPKHDFEVCLNYYSVQRRIHNPIKHKRLRILQK